MKYIDELTEELRIAAEELAVNVINREEFDLKLDLLIFKIERISINYGDADRLSFQSGIFNQLLFQKRFKAVEALRELKRIDDKRKFNAKIRHILAEKLHFKSLHHTLKRNVDLIQIRDGKKNIEPQIFISKGQENFSN